MPSFLVEVYAPESARAGLPALAARAEAAAKMAASAGIEIQHVRSFITPDDEVCFHLFEAASADTVAQMSAVTRFDHERITEVIE